MPTRAVATLLGLVLLVVACGESASREVEVLVSAAASLTDAFTEMAGAFEATSPGVEVVLNFAGSSTLREQILGGAPVDVFASANLANMTAVVDEGEIDGAPRIFARNRLQIAVPAGNQAGVRGLADFGDEDLLIGICVRGVPCGDLARAVLAAAGVTPAVDTEEPDVRALITKIEAGELDAALTYVTDVVAAEGAVGIDLPPGMGDVADYPIGVLARAPNSEHGAAFVDFVLSPAGRAILTRHGFEVP